MRWEHKYPNAKVDEEVPGRDLYRSGIIGKCFMCNKYTSWVDICFEGHLCSQECEAAAFQDIEDRTKRQDAEINLVPF